MADMMIHRRSIEVVRYDCFTFSAYKDLAYSISLTMRLQHNGPF